jgi:hypothetical protein
MDGTMYQVGDLVKPLKKLSIRETRFSDQKFNILEVSHYGSFEILGVPYGIYLGTTRIKKNLKSSIMMLKHIYLFGDTKCVADPELFAMVE